MTRIVISDPRGKRPKDEVPKDKRPVTDKPMDSYASVAEHLAEVLEGKRYEGGIDPESLPDLIGERVGMEFNCYPGIPGSECCQVAFFISLQSPTCATEKHLTCRQAIVKLVQHMQGPCQKTTKVAILIADNWDPAAYDEWRGNLERIKQSARLETYLICGSASSKVGI